MGQGWDCNWWIFLLVLAVIGGVFLLALPIFVGAAGGWLLSWLSPMIASWSLSTIGLLPWEAGAVLGFVTTVLSGLVRLVVKREEK